MKRDTLIVIESNTDLAAAISSYFKTHKLFKKIIIYNALHQLQDIDLTDIIILLNTHVVAETEMSIQVSQLISKSNVPVILYSAFDEPELTHIIDSLELGAIEAIPSKVFYDSHSRYADQLVFNNFLKELQKGTFSFDFTLLRNRIYPSQLEKTSKKKKTGIVTIGCDLGSMSSLLGLIPQFPQDFSMPVCILLNGHTRLIDAFCDRLSINSALPVKKVLSPTQLNPGTVYIIQANRGPILDIDRDNNVNIFLGCAYPFDLALKYWIDQFMQTAADIYRRNSTGILLGGLQYDGLQGINYIQQMKGNAIVQSEQSCPLKQRVTQARKIAGKQQYIYLGEIAEKIVSL